MATAQASGLALLMIVVTPGGFIAHLLLVGRYAAVFFLMERKLGLGASGGESTTGRSTSPASRSPTSPRSASAASAPRGRCASPPGCHRWTASSTWLAMETFWDRHRRPARLSP
jgi:hypothetical protein